MADVALNDLMLLQFIGYVYGQKFVLTHTLKATTVTGAQSILTAQGDVVDKFKEGGANDLVTPWAACLQSSATVKEITAQRIHPVRMRKYSFPQDKGGLAGASEASNLASPIQFVTQFGGRKQSANKHIGPLAFGTGETLIKDGLLTGAYIGLFQDLADIMLTSVTSNAGNVTWTPCIIHRAKEKPHAITGSDVYDNWRIKGTLSSQRTRIIGKGE